MMSAKGVILMNTRIKMLRKALDLSQRAFADRIGISGPSVARIESGENNPSKQTIELICSKFNVNPEWLKDGADVPMFLEVADDDEILIARVMAGEDEFRKSVFRAFSKMDDESWEMLRQVVDQIKNAGR